LARTRRSTEPPAAARKRVVVTGGAGLVGRALVRVLRERGDTVVALVRDPRRASFLAELGADLVTSDLATVEEIAEQLRSADAVIHAAGSYRVGITKAERGAMWDANVGTTTRMLDAAERAGTARFVYVSTVNVFGNTHGRVVDETYRRDLAEGFLSWYDETKYGAHEVAEQRIAARAPVVIVLPSQVYGPGDRSVMGEQVRLAHEGRLRYRVLDGFGIGFVHADDLATGIVAALDRGADGRSYILSGPRTTLEEVLAIAARIGGHSLPRLRLPDGLVRVMAPVGGLIGQPNLGELVDASVGVTYLGSSARAEEELGFTARDVETGLRDVYGGTAASAASG
jgi:dihydroflavonol-4-reductase